MAGEIVAPAWLPALICVDGDWHDTERRLLNVYHADFTHGHLTLDGCPVWTSRDPEADDTVPRSFRHLITRDDRPGSGHREFNPRRAERLAWVGALIRNSGDQAVKRWDYREGDGRINTYIWLEALDFIVILRPKINRGRKVFWLVTAYHIDYDGTRKSYARKYAQRAQQE